MRALWNNLPLHWRLFSGFGSLLALTLLISLLLLSHFHAQERIERLLAEEIPTQLAHLRTEISARLLPSIEHSKSLAHNTEIERWVESGMPEEGMEPLVQQMQRLYSLLAINTVFVVGHDGEQQHYYSYHQDTFQHRPLLDDHADDGWYFRFIASGAPYELNLDTNEFTGEQLIMFVNYRSQATADTGKPLVVAGVGIDMLALADMISDYRLGESGRAALVNQSGVIEVQAADHRSVLEPEQIQALLDEHQPQVMQVQHSGERLLVGTIWLGELQRYLLIEVPQAEFMAPIYRQLRIMLLIGTVLLIVSLSILYPLANGLIRPLTRFGQELSAISHSLDLTQRVSIPNNREMAQLAHQTNRLLERLMTAIKRIETASTELNANAQRLAQTAGLVDRRHQQQLDVEHSMAAAVEQMSSSVAEITSTMEELSASSSQIADHSQSVVDAANLTLDKTNQGVVAMEQLHAQMECIHHDNQQNLTEITALGAKSKQISKVMALINTLADQTRLIAFNAALEASSAGDAGRRFAVVAGEIRRLADSVTDSTKEIETHTQEIQDAIERLVVTSEKGAESIANGMTSSAETAARLFNDQLQAATQTSNAAKHISLSTQQQKVASNQVVIALRDISNASTHNAQSVREITQISEDMVALSAGLSALVQEFHR